MSGYLLYYVIEAFSIAGAGFALWKGANAERLAACVVLLNMGIGFVGTWLLPEAQGVIRLTNDGLAALALLGVTIRYAAPWMGGVMFFYAAQFSMHSYYLVTGRPDTDLLHAVVNNINWNGVIWCLIIGTALSWRQRARAARAAHQPAP